MLIRYHRVREDDILPYMAHHKPPQTRTPLCVILSEVAERPSRTFAGRIFRGKAVKLSEQKRAQRGICDGFARCLLDQSNILYLPQPLAYRTAEDVGPYKGIINRLPDPQSAILAL